MSVTDTIFRLECLAHCATVQAMMYGHTLGRWRDHSDGWQRVCIHCRRTVDVWPDIIKPYASILGAATSVPCDG
jgi:hypothetical protein